MLHSSEINEISKALAQAQGEISAAKKDGANPHFKSKFASLNSHWEVCRAVLSKNGLAVTQLTDILEDGRDVLVTILSHSSGQWFKSSMVLKPVKNDPQGMGSCLTYARRYMLSAIVGTTSDDEDDDAELASGRGKTVPSPASFVSKQPVPEVVDVISSTEAHELLRLRASLNENDRKIIDAWVKKTYNIDSLDQLPSCHFEKILTSLVKKVQESRNENTSN